MSKNLLLFEWIKLGTRKNLAMEYKGDGESFVRVWEDTGLRKWDCEFAM